MVEPHLVEGEQEAQPGPRSLGQLGEDGEGQPVLQGQGDRLGGTADLPDPTGIGLLAEDLAQEGGHHLGVVEGVEGHGQTVVVLEDTEDGILVAGQEPRLSPGLAQPQHEVDRPLPDPGHHVDDAGPAPGHDLGFEDPDGLVTVGAAVAAHEMGGDQPHQGVPGALGEAGDAGGRWGHRGTPAGRCP